MIRNNYIEFLDKCIIDNTFFEFLTGDCDSGVFQEGNDTYVYPCGIPEYTDMEVVMETIHKSDYKNIKLLFENGLNEMLNRKGKYLFQVLEILNEFTYIIKYNDCKFEIDINRYYDICCKEIENEKETLKKLFIYRYNNKNIYQLCLNYKHLLRKKIKKVV